jgi:hypothetical protein
VHAASLYRRPENLLRGSARRSPTVGPVYPLCPQLHQLASEMSRPGTWASWT